MATTHIAAGPPDPVQTVIEQAAEGKPADAYCAVTVVSGSRRLDVALPTTVCSADLLPGLLRLIRRDDLAGTPEPWELCPIVGPAIKGSDTLTSAGVLAGDVLILRQWSAEDRHTSAVVTTRDRIDDVVNGHARFWEPRTSRSLAHWTSILVAVALLFPAATLPTGPSTAGTAVTVAIIVALIAVLADRRAEKACAAIGLLVGCGWAALAGASSFGSLVSVPGVTGQAVAPVTIVVAAGSALLLACCAAAGYPTALVHTTALLVFGIACGVLAAVPDVRSRIVDTGCIAAVIAVLVLGALPRVALAIGGLTTGDGGGAGGRESAELDSRIARAGRVLIGLLVGVSVVAAAGAIPAALSGAAGPRLLALGIGALLLLRSRAFSQTLHVLAPRIGGLVVLAALWLGLYRGDASLRSSLILAAVLGSAALTVIIAVLGRAASPVGRARSGRILDLAEQLLVVALIVLTAGVVVVFDWMLSVVG